MREINVLIINNNGYSRNLYLYNVPNYGSAITLSMAANSTILLKILGSTNPAHTIIQCADTFKVV